MIHEACLHRRCGIHLSLHIYTISHGKKTLSLPHKTVCLNNVVEHNSVRISISTCAFRSICRSSVCLNMEHQQNNAMEMGCKHRGIFFSTAGFSCWHKQRIFAKHTYLCSDAKMIFQNFKPIFVSHFAKPTSYFHEDRICILPQYAVFFMHTLRQWYGADILSLATHPLSVHHPPIRILW